ncbi:tRNA pseudouridine(13) synthase TruD [Saccharolobus shibatae]|uniref:tRNA pseudouridine(13) synthase n=1 Tax=Saccharolobus shibatae TaxID=2286 RepID=A0A8F5BXZ5_9CREN|nr:tRNA pseudouridine(13) synthase TruD [Saccharolobus shibatae]QXJ33552.1 tRNA pseudouridine(13) synthase [Saccharolobus shibatae]
MIPHEIDIVLGMERYYYEDWNEIDGTIERPNGFKVVEEIDFKPAHEWKGEEKGKYAVYLLTKWGIDHFSVLSEIQKVLHSKVNYMGIKDANAVTSQLVYITLTKKQELINEYKSNSFILKFLGYSSTKFNHTGNIFEISLLTSNFDLVVERVRQIEKNPYLPAFIGYQRFGTRRPITHLIGKYLLKRDWEKAFYLILTYPFLSESKEIIEIRKLIMEGDFNEAVRLIPSKFKQEKLLLKNYMKFNSYYLALKNSFIPISLYLDAYQSYLFNMYLSRRLDEYKNSDDKDNLFIRIPIYFNDCDDICKEIYLNEGIEKNFFKLLEFKISLKSFNRKAFMNIRNLKINEETRTISFVLDRGMYATVLLREILRGDPRKFT